MSTVNETRAHSLTFGEAMHILITDKRPIICSLWSADEQLSVNCNTVRVAEKDLWNPLNKKVAKQNGGFVKNLPYFTKVKGDTVQMGWTPTQEEMLAEWRAAGFYNLLFSLKRKTNSQTLDETIELEYQPGDANFDFRLSPYWMLYSQNMVKENVPVVFASTDMTTNIINCLIYDSMLASYNSELLTPIYDGFVLKKEDIANGSWRDLLNQRSSLYTLATIEDAGQSFVNFIQELTDRPILIADAKTMTSETVQLAISQHEALSGIEITPNWVLIDFDEQADYSLAKSASISDEGNDNEDSFF